MDGYYFSRGSFLRREHKKGRKKSRNHSNLTCAYVWKCMFSANPLEPDTLFSLLNKHRRSIRDDVTMFSLNHQVGTRFELDALE